jgi:TPP-dependent pyruvate/acetoin dehydrogenase alpha subunit
LNWEKDWDCNTKFREYILSNQIATADLLDQIEAEAKAQAKKDKEAAWAAFSGEIKKELAVAVSLLSDAAQQSTRKVILEQMAQELSKTINPIRKDVITTVRFEYCQIQVERLVQGARSPEFRPLQFAFIQSI